MTILTIPDMSCDHCKATVTKTIHRVDEAAKLDFNMEAQQVTVDSQADLATLTQALAAAGYPATAI